MNHRVCCLLTTLTLLLARGAPQAPAQIGAGPTETPIVQASNDFGFALASRLNRDGNLFFSPGSISAAFHLAYAGARGETATEMARVLGLGDLDPESPDFDRAVAALIARLDREIPSRLRRRQADGEDQTEGGGRLDLVNALWGQEGHPFRADYLKRLTTAFGGELHQLDFAGDPQAARRTINERIAADTQDKIRDLLPEDAIDAATLLVLTNAIYFKNAWAEPFRESATRDQAFETKPGAEVTVPMMRRQGHYAYVGDDLLQALRIPYAQGGQSMLVVLPTKRHDLASVEKALDRKRLEAILMASKRSMVSLELPRFKLEQSFELREALRAMGMRRAFDAAAADFSGIDDGAGRLVISRVIHKTFVDVDEHGTEAAAATAIVMKRGSARPSAEPIPFVCDQPFLFFIVDDATGLVLFQGRCADPRG